MKMPGFTAEESFYKIREYFKSIEYCGNYTGAQVIIPQKIKLCDCDPEGSWCSCWYKGP